MEKMTWSKPVAIAEQFMPNEYISACFSIACDYGEAGQTVGGRRHSTTGCGNPNNQSVTVFKGSFDIPGSVCEIGITEHNVIILGQNRGDRTGYFINPTDAGEVANRGTERTSTGVNNTIYWVTNVGLLGNDIWMVHKGTINYTKEGRPKHS